MTVPARFVHVGFNFTSTPPTAALEKVFANARDWLRYEEHCWVLYSTTDIETWRDRIRNTPGILPGDSFFLCEFTAYTGFMHDWAWKWIKKHDS